MRNQISCVDTLTKHITTLIESKAYLTVLYCIDVAKGRELAQSLRSYDKYHCSEGMIENLTRDDNSEMTPVPFVTPRGVFGVNTFIACYYNGLYPIGISSNPIAPRGTDVGYSSSGLAEHDLDHFFLSFKNFDNYFVYQHILTMSEVDKAKGLIYIMFIMLHDPEGDERMRTHTMKILLR